MTVMFYMAHNPARSHKVKHEAPGEYLRKMPSSTLEFGDFIIMTSVFQYFREFSIMSIDHELVD